MRRWVACLHCLFLGPLSSQVHMVSLTTSWFRLLSLTNWFQKHLGFCICCSNRATQTAARGYKWSDFNALSNNLWFIYMKDLGLFRYFCFCEQNTPLFVSMNSCLQDKNPFNLRKNTCWRKTQVIRSKTLGMTMRKLVAGWLGFTWNPLTQPLSIIKHQTAPRGTLRIQCIPTEARKVRIRAWGHQAPPPSVEGALILFPPQGGGQVLPVIS